MNIQRLLSYLTNRGKSVIPSEKGCTYVDLAPVDCADPDGSYSKALEFALGNGRIKNIALTGPYGSGKSSIIKTFETNSRRKYSFLNISLASFKEDNTSNTDKESQNRLIERSILQQMLYGADANNLPYSRFKRISTPEHALLKSLLLVFWIISSYGLYLNKSELINFHLYSTSWWLLVGLITFVLAMPVVLISDIYKTLFGISLKKISLTNAEIETGNQTEDSILNRHLDEIIYFFQSTSYNVVVIEDLDRFGDPEIFVKLREINKLINDNEQTSGNIKFLYALKDDMFIHKNRAKFFDFIIPVVPIINSFNSLDMMQGRLKSLALEKSINSQFLREVSLYIDDLRLIHNIFNEFLIYYDRLKSESLDVTKLLAMMIYKNVYPNDFESLHYGKGVLYEICNKKSEYLHKIKNELSDELGVLRASLESTEKEKARSIRELINTYIGHIVSHTNQSVLGIVCANQHVLFNQLTTYEKFEPLISEKSIYLATNQQNYREYRIAINKSFEQIENEINPGETFFSRKQNIDNRSDENRKRIQEKIPQLEKEIAKLPQIKLSQLLVQSEVSFDENLTKLVTSEKQLLVYLVRNGYLDDSYYLYTSNFHEGRLTKNDRDFLITIRNFHHPDPDQQIDNPKEVCANMREEDFGQKYVLNVTLMDYLLEKSSENSKHIEAANKYISENCVQSEEFFSAYFISGKHLDSFIKNLCATWPGFSSAALTSKQAAEKISYILRFVDAAYIENSMNSEGVLSDYLADQGHLVFASNIPSPEKYDVLKKLNIRFLSLLSLEMNELLLDYLHEESLYAITPENVNYVLQKYAHTPITDEFNIEKANYTSICTMGSNFLKGYIDENLADYIDKVFLVLPENSMEDGTAIKALINNEKIKNSQKKEIVSKQKYIFETFDGVPAVFWTHLIEEGKITVSWKNISVYLGSENPNNKLVTELIQKPDNVNKLLKQNISEAGLEEEKSKSLSRFVLNNDEIKDHNYCKLINCLSYSYIDFPSDVSENKLEILAKERTVKLTKESFASAAENNKLIASLIEKNFDDYLANKETYPIDDKVRELLLLSELNQDHKIKICHDVTTSGAINNKSLLALIANVISQNDVDCSKIDTQILSAVIINAENEDDSIQILIKCLPNWSETVIMDVLSQLNEPYSEIASYGKRPKLSNNILNSRLSELLKGRGFISSVKKGNDGIRIITRKSADLSERG